MPRRNATRRLLAGCAALTLVLPACTQKADKAEAGKPWPAGNITMVVHTTPGSATDRFTRVVGEQLQQEFTGISVVAENREGGSGAVALNYLLSKPADGLTLAGWTPSFSGVLAKPDVPFKLDDFEPICLLMSNPHGFWVRKEGPYQTLEDFIAAAKARPGKLTIAGFGVGGGTHVATLNFEKAAGIDITYVPFEGGEEANHAVMNGQADAIMGNPREGVVNGRVLAVSGTIGDVFNPDLPTFEKLGYQVDDIQWRGVIAKAGTPPETIAAIKQTLTKISQQQDWKDFAKQFQHAEDVDCSDGFKQMISNEIEAVRAILKDA